MHCYFYLYVAYLYVCGVLEEPLFEGSEDQACEDSKQQDLALKGKLCS
jgi:hypothetical protein